LLILINIQSYLFSSYHGHITSLQVCFLSHVNKDSFMNQQLNIYCFNLIIHDLLNHLTFYNAIKIDDLYVIIILYYLVFIFLLFLDNLDRNLRKGFL